MNKQTTQIKLIQYFFQAFDGLDENLKLDHCISFYDNKILISSLILVCDPCILVALFHRIIFKIKPSSENQQIRTV